MTPKVIEKPLPNFHTGWPKQPWIVVVHYSAGYNADSCYEALKAQGLSAHCTIERDGIIHRHVSDENRALHAGYGTWGGVGNMNSQALGVEIANLGWLDGPFDPKTTYLGMVHGTEVNIDSDGHEYVRREGEHTLISRVRAVKPMDHRPDLKAKLWSAYADIQLDSTFWLIQSWIRKFNILPESVLGHEHVDPARKIDPGPHFPWLELKEYVEDELYDEMPALFDPKVRTSERVKAVQSHCHRLGIDVGDIDGAWGKKTQAGVETAVAKYGGIYGFNSVSVSPSNVYEVACALRSVPGFNPGPR